MCCGTHVANLSDIQVSDVLETFSGILLFFSQRACDLIISLSEKFH